jgi:hypothetical protein
MRHGVVQQRHTGVGAKVINTQQLVIASSEQEPVILRLQEAERNKDSKKIYSRKQSSRRILSEATHRGEVDRLDDMRVLE